MIDDVDAKISKQEESENSVDDNSLALTRNAINPGYNFRKSTLECHIYAALTQRPNMVLKLQMAL